MQEAKASPPTASLLLTVYRPGVYDPALYAGGTEVSVGGRRGLFKPKYDGAPGLAWQYGDNAWAVIDSNGINKSGPQDLVAIAEGLRGSAHPATVAVQLAETPLGYRVSSVGPGDGVIQRTHLDLVRGEESWEGPVTRADIDDGPGGGRYIQINMYSSDFPERRPPKGAGGDHRQRPGDPGRPQEDAGRAPVRGRRRPGDLVPD